MNEILKDKISYCHNRLTELINSSVKDAKDLNFLLEEYFFFNLTNKSFRERTYDIYSKRCHVHSKYAFKKIIQRELDDINTFKYADDEIAQYLSPYGSLYYGDGILYYNDTLMSYNDEQFFHIILNHILHYVLGLLFTNSSRTSDKRTDKNKSFITLALHHLDIIHEPVYYSLNKRAELYSNLGSAVNNYIIFDVNKIENVGEFLLKNVYNDTRYFVRNKSTITNNRYYENMFTYQSIQIAQYSVYVNEPAIKSSSDNQNFINACENEIKSIVYGDISVY